MRKDNDLLILANKGVSKPKFWNPILDTCFRRKSQETPQKPLKGHFTDYASEFIDCTSPCERLPDDYQNHLDRKYTKKIAGVLDIEGFRAWCEALDKDKAWIEKTERELF